FLFGDRHTTKPLIRNNILNAIDLWNRRILSFVGVEGLFKKDEPVWCYQTRLEDIYKDLRNQHGDMNDKLVEGLLASLPDQQCFFFAKILRLLLPDLPLDSIEDQALNSKAEALHLTYENRLRLIHTTLDQAELYLPTSKMHGITDEQEKLIVRRCLVEQKAI